MPERPLLIFPTPQSAERESGGGGGASKFHKPSHHKQSERVGVKLKQLQQAFTTRAMEIQSNASGIDPSQVIVIETIGSVENFAIAVKNINGAEWLGEFEIEEIVPDDDFYDANTKGERTDKTLRGRLYLIHANQIALQQMLTLWTRYQSDPNMSWPDGLTTMRDVFDTLYEIRRWDIRDRLNETGALEAWRDDLEHYPDQPIRTEVELWYRETSFRRDAAESEVNRLVINMGGVLLNRCTIESIAYHSLLVELPRSAVTSIIESSPTELVRSDNIMFFRPTGQMTVGKHPVDGEFVDFPERLNANYPTGDPCVAILDGLPVENHTLLADRIILDDPDDIAPHYLVRDRVHGTSMCSLVIWGDLSEEQPPLARPVYVRPIMKPVDSWHSVPFPEQVPTNELVVDLVHRSVRRIFEVEGDEPAAAQTVKIINLSVGDPSRPFFQLISPLARLLDWLSHKYRVLFVISAGNQIGNIYLGVTESEFLQLSENERERLVILKLYADSRNRRLLSPAESINAVTVNAIHHDGGVEGRRGGLIECFPTRLPSPISAFGGGYRRSIKPDIAVSGGRVLYQFSPVGQTIRCTGFRNAPGHQVAVPGISGEVSKTAYCRGTSNAAALTSRNLAIAHDSLLELLAEQPHEIDTKLYLTPLLKALLIHSCDWDEVGQRLREHLQTLTDTNAIRHWVSRWLGYGEPDVRRMLECTGQRATVLGFGTLRDEQGHVFNLPLPPSLGSTKTKRRLTVTLAWLSAINAANQKYRVAQLWFDDPAKRILASRLDADHQAVRRGTVQHEIFEGDGAFVVGDGDSLQIKINCRKDAAPIDNAVHYGLAVSLEVAEGLDFPIYQEVREGIRMQMAIKEKDPIR